MAGSEAQTETYRVDAARCLERGLSAAQVTSSVVNPTTCFSSRSVTIIIYYIEMKYSIVQSVKKQYKTQTTGYVNEPVYLIM